MESPDLITLKFTVHIVGNMNTDTEGVFVNFEDNRGAYKIWIGVFGKVKINGGIACWIV